MIANTPEAWDGRSLTGASWEAALWSEEGQTQRFLAVLRHLDIREEDCLLDMGCGTGRFSAFLPRSVEYYGYDWSEKMRERARAEHPTGFFIDSLPPVLWDHVVAIGTYNLASDWTKDETWRSLSDLWSECVRRTLVVSLYRGDDPSCLRYTGADLAKFAGIVGCSRYIIDTTYLPNDILLEMRR